VAALSYAATVEYRSVKEYRDEAGNVRVRIGVIGDTPTLEMLDKTGKQQVVINCDNTGQAHITLLDAKTGNVLVVALDGNGPNVTMIEQMNSAQVTVSRGLVVREGR
jgi:hypothetical protein